MMGSDLTNFHRSLSTYLRGFLDTGFLIVDLIEPTATGEWATYYPELEDERRAPNFIIYVLEKR